MVRTAIIGAGKAQASQTKLGGYQIGYTHAAAYARNQQCKLVAVADIVQSHLDAFNERFDAIGYLDYRQMLVTERPDVVSICTYVGLHYEMLEAAVHAGVKAVLCEKPFVATVPQLNAIRARSRAFMLYVSTAYDATGTAVKHKNTMRQVPFMIFQYYYIHICLTR